MPLADGARLGPYEILSAAGAGGMGEVYRARDTRLDRTVAIKVLPSALAGDAEFRARFDREARAVSSLNHPHICALYDVGCEAGIDFLVLEFLEGETLAGRITRTGALPPNEALKIASEVAGALDWAHRAGIVHRDLKPANVMLTKSGAKLLDFGLAKSAAPGVAATGLSMLPTTPHGVTAQGTILGTFQYMAPEQIEGLEADARTDIFAFGALLFEMMTGRPAFEGKTRASLLGAILKDEPPRISSLKPLSPASIDRIVATCLAKDPDDRWQSARDVLHELRWAASGPPDSDARPAAAAAASRRPWLVAGALGLALLASSALVVRHARETPGEALQFNVAPPETTLFGGLPGGGTGIAPQLAVSPDGRHIVFVAGGPTGYRLWLRPLGSLESRLLAGTEEAAFPFWSPDSRFVAFFAAGKLKKVQISGGPPIVLCDVARGLGGTWSRDNIILFSVTPDSGGSVLLRVPAAGGAPVAASVIDKTNGETSHRWPHFLPDGRHFLYTAATGTCCPAAKPSIIRAGTLDSTESANVFVAESSVAYGAGYLLFFRAPGTLMAQRFDPATRQLTGDAFPVADHVANEGSRYGSFGMSETGVLVYARGAARPTTRLMWFDRAGNVTGTVGEPAGYYALALAPDERRIAVSLPSGTSENRAIWIIDSARGGAMSRVTFDSVDDTAPLWSPDGSRLAFQSVRVGESSLRQKALNGTATDEPLLVGQQLFPTAWSQNGRFIAYTRNNSGSPDVWILPLTGDRKPFAFAQTSFAKRTAAFSPDGRWLAYESNESGQSQVYVQPFPATFEKHLVSIRGGQMPSWRGDGKELFFLGSDSKIMAATIDTATQFEAGVPQALFPVAISTAITSRQFAVSGDGQRFLVNVRTAPTTVEPLTVVVNWLASVQK